MKKEAGILLPIFSLDGRNSIGTLGNDAKTFIDFLYNNDFTWWQILPINMTDEFHSPYNSPSIYSINPLFIDLEVLYCQGLISKKELISEQKDNLGRCAYTELDNNRYKTLYKAFERFTDYSVLLEFGKNNKHIMEFCEFQSIKEQNPNTNWNKWEKKIYPQERLYFWLFLQYEGYRQYYEIKKYAAKKNIKIIGDMPMYSSYNSSEVFFYPYYYQLDSEFSPIFLSGAKPDGFSSKGQCWGHPVYNWNKIAQNNYRFWIEKISHMASLYDGIRLDHFRGYESFWSIPSQTTDALQGIYQQGPGIELFKSSQKITQSKIMVGEDLGITDPKVQKLIDELEFDTMRVIQYILYQNNEKDNPDNYSYQSIAYTGTHDNQTLIGYLNSLSPKEEEALNQKLKKRENESLFQCIIRNLYESKAHIVIFPIQDVLRLDDNFVFNTHKPSNFNWSFRINHDYLFNNSNVELFCIYNRKGKNNAKYLRNM